MKSARVVTRAATVTTPSDRSDEPILVDTNILVYAYDPSQPIKQARARQVLTALEESRRGRLSAQVLAEFFSVATRKLLPPLTPREALDQVGLFAEVWPVFAITPEVVLEAGRGVRDHQLSYYDAQLWATALRNQVTVVFSEDYQDGAILEGVRFVNPFASSFVIGDWI